jgi:hypothetical protein
MNIKQTGKMNQQEKLESHQIDNNNYSKSQF